MIINLKKIGSPMLWTNIKTEILLSLHPQILFFFLWLKTRMCSKE